MAAQPEPATISWRETLSLLVERGYSEGAAKDTLLRAVVDASVGYYPRRAVSLETQYRKGLLDLETGALRMSHRDDNPWYIRVVASDFERQFPQRRGSSTIGGEKKAIAFLADRLKTDHNMRRDGAWEACREQFPKMSERGFRFRVWPQAREAAGLEPSASAGRKPKRKPQTP
jgi:hypothetical protein